MKIRISKLELAFWIILTLCAGTILGTVLLSISINNNPRKCNDGTSVQIRDDVKLKTYIPALDECKENK